MISLPALEEPFARAVPADARTARAWPSRGWRLPAGGGSCCSRRSRWRCARPTRLLAEAGFRGVMRLDEVRQVDAIPVLGTGKTDYKVLRTMIEGG